MARYKLILAYDGTGFAGSQRQAGRRTVQGCLEEALHALGWSGRAVQMAGRTDAGVHASGQVAAFDLEWAPGDEQLRRALNSGLPPDLAVWHLEQASPEFHPRFSAASRSYLYRVFASPTRDPLRERYAWRVWPMLVGPELVAAASAFLGRHDFAAFGTTSRPQATTIRTVSESGWTETDQEWQYRVTCEAFLYRMVRRMVFVQVAVAQGRCSREALRKALDDAEGAPERKFPLPAGLAPARGLTLVGVEYGSSESRRKRSVESVQDLLSEGR